MAIQIKRAVKYGAKLKLALYGPSGAGKTYTALTIAHAMKGDGKVIVIDTERGSASKYADAFPEYDVIELTNFHPNQYIEAIKAVIAAREYSVLIIDSATHEWDGSNGSLELAGSNFTNWANVTPKHNAFVDAMLAADIHVIATMRAKEEHIMKEVEQKGIKKTVVEKVGMEPIQRKGMLYEFDIVGALDISNVMTIGKTRCIQLKDMSFKPGNEQELVSIMQRWLDGTPAPEPLPDIIQIYERGKVTGVWTKESFFATASGILSGFPVTQENYKKLDAEHLKQLSGAVEQEPLSLLEGVTS